MKQDAFIYGFKKECFLLLRFRDMLKYNIIGIYDVSVKENIGVDAGSVMGISDINIKIHSNLQYLLNETTVVIIVDSNPWGEQEEYVDCMIKIIESGKKIFSIYEDLSRFAPLLDRIKIPFQTFIKKNKSEYNYEIVSRNFIEQNQIEIDNIIANDYQSKIPVIGIFGTSSCQGKFTAQLSLRRALKKLNINVANIATEPTGKLLGCEYEIMRREYNGSIIFNCAVGRLVTKKLEENNFECVIFGGQSFILPYSFISSQFFVGSKGNRLVSTRLFYMYNPSHILLMINSSDPVEYVLDSIGYMKNLKDIDIIGLGLMDGERKGKYLKEKFVKIPEKKMKSIKKIWMAETGQDVYVITNVNDMDNLAKKTAQMIQDRKELACV